MTVKSVSDYSIVSVMTNGKVSAAQHMKVYMLSMQVLIA